MSALERGRVSALGLVVLFALGAAAAVGCGWVGTEHSVRFNGRRNEQQFSRLPPLPFDARKRTKPDYREEEDSETPVSEPGKDADKVWASADESARRGDFAQARKLWGEYLKLTESGSGDESYDTLAGSQERRNSARDRLEASEALDHGTNGTAVGAYFAARRAYDEWVAARDEVKEADTKNPNAKFDAWWARQGKQEQTTEEGEQTAQDGKQESLTEQPTHSLEAVNTALRTVPSDRNIEDNVEYLRAAVLYRENRTDEAAHAFEQLAARHPRSEKREASLFTLGMLRLRESSSFTGEHAAADKPCADCRDDAWQSAFESFGRVLREYPRGRYAGDARGWLAYLHVRVGERAEGLAEYYRMLADESDASAREEALRSLRLVRGGATGEEMLRVESLIENEPRVALTYAYHSVYNVALGSGFDIEVPEEQNPYRYCKDDAEHPCWNASYEWEAKERGRQEESAEHKELARIAAFATRLMRRHPLAAVGGGFALRVAQANLELGDNSAARELAARALSSGARDNERASALWVKGVAEHRLRNFVAARRTFTSLVEEFPEGDLTEGARRYIALAAEDAGDLFGALEQYLVLDYTDDVAYFVDVLLTPEQLADFIERHADSPARDMLLYSLAVRYMRARRFDEARANYARVRTADETESNNDDSSYSGSERDSDDTPPQCGEAKNPRWDAPKDVQTAWVLCDLKTMDEIEHLEDGVRRASGDEEKAEALYRQASYLYESSDLTFYNPAAWQGGRFFAIYYDQKFRAPGEAALMRRYMEEHEPLVRALDIYLRVAEDYPRTRAARDALFTAAVIHERLPSLQLYWPGQYRQGLYAGARFVTYKDVRRIYPDYRLPVGSTFYWEPSTRTVNGHAAWPAPPRVRQLTGMERARLKIRRAERRLSKGWELFGEIYGGRVRNWTLNALRWLLVALVAACVLLVFRRTRRTRRFLYRQLKRRPKPYGAGHMREVYAPASSYAAHIPRARGGGLRAAAGQTAHGLLRLALHERGRAALALNLFTHGLLSVLLWAVLWAVKAG